MIFFLKTLNNSKIKNVASNECLQLMDENIRVAVRCRPLLEDEDQARSVSIHCEKNCIVYKPQKKSFFADLVFNTNDNNLQVYNQCVAPIVTSVLNEGTDATVFAYGQTSSGKTWTMFGSGSNELVPQITNTPLNSALSVNQFVAMDNNKKQNTFNFGSLDAATSVIHDTPNPKNRQQMKKYCDVTNGIISHCCSQIFEHIIVQNELQSIRKHDNLDATSPLRPRRLVMNEHFDSNTDTSSINASNETDFVGLENIETEYLIMVSVVEIYNEKVYDLLNVQNNNMNQNFTYKQNRYINVKSLEVRENVTKSKYYIADLSHHIVKSKHELISLIQNAHTFRQIGSTKKNSYSSRSHCIVTIYIDKTIFDKNTGNRTQIKGKINLVDLAGSEKSNSFYEIRSNKQKAETASINQSLSCLSDVIHALSNQSRTGRKQHVPYRSSKLTRILKDSLGGNSKSLMIACINPTITNGTETLSTLRFCGRVKMVKNRVEKKIKQISADSPLSKVERSTLIKLQREIQALKGLVTKRETTHSKILKIIKKLDLSSIEKFPTKNIPTEYLRNLLSPESQKHIRKSKTIDLTEKLDILHSPRITYRGQDVKVSELTSKQIQEQILNEYHQQNDSKVINDTLLTLINQLQLLESCIIKDTDDINGIDSANNNDLQPESPTRLLSPRTGKFVSSLESSMKSFKHSYVRQLRNNTNLQIFVSKLENDNSDLQNKLNEMLVQTNEDSQTIQDLQATVDELQSQLDSVEESRRQEILQKTNLQKKYNKLYENIDNVHTQYVEQVNKLKNDVESQRYENERLQNEFQDSNKKYQNQINSLNHILQTSKNKCDLLRLENSTLTSQNQDIKSQKAKLAEQANKSMVEMDTMINKYGQSQKQVEEMEREKYNYVKKIEDLEQELNQAVESSQDHKTKIDQMTTSHNNLEMKYNETLQLSHKTQSELDSARFKIANFENEHKFHIETQNKQKEHLQNCEKKNKELSLSYDKAMQNYKKYKQLYDDKVSLLNSNISEIDAMKLEISNLNLRNSELKQQHTKEIEKMQFEINRLKTINSRTENRFNSLRNQITTLNDKLSCLQEKNDDHVRYRKQLELELKEKLKQHAANTQQYKKQLSDTKTRYNELESKFNAHTKQNSTQQHSNPNNNRKTVSRNEFNSLIRKPFIADEDTTESFDLNTSTKTNTICLDTDNNKNNYKTANSNSNANNNDNHIINATERIGKIMGHVGFDATSLQINSQFNESEIEQTQQGIVCP